ncbi:hypothetical protein LCGC14_1715120 [marine sediment metagenome]|uniref:Uncharacterized protein n=1 Tax=marine sediment metagenome TaxID=412755 RepID=A0A0F9HEI6_9ZZZZ
MNDITKARFFLKTRGSKLHDLQSFGLMLATAEANYRDVKMRRVGAPGDHTVIDPIEVEALVEFACLRHLKRTNRLPDDAGLVFQDGITLERKRELALSWLN